MFSVHIVRNAVNAFTGVMLETSSCNTSSTLGSSAYRFDSVSLCLFKCFKSVHNDYSEVLPIVFFAVKTD